MADCHGAWVPAMHSHMMVVRSAGGGVCGLLMEAQRRHSQATTGMISGAVEEDVAGSSNGVVAEGVATEGVGEGAAEVTLAEIVSGAIEAGPVVGPVGGPGSRPGSRPGTRASAAGS